MKFSILSLIVFALLAGTCNEERTPEYLVLKGATAFDGNGESIENATIVIQDGKILHFGGSAISIPKNSEVIDISGKYLTPGLIDSHVHFFQTGFFDSRPDAFDIRDTIPYEEVQEHVKNNPQDFYEAYLRSGITAVYDVGGFPWSIDLQKSTEDDLNAPHVSASGILLTPAPEERLTTFNLPGDTVIRHITDIETGRRIVIQNSQQGSTGIKIWGTTPNDSDFEEKISAIEKEIKAQGNKMIVHATTLEQAKLALKHGAKLLVHSVGDVVVDEEFIELAKENDVIYSPTLVVSRGYYNTYMAILGNNFPITDPNLVVDKRTMSLLNNAPKFEKYISGSKSDFETRMKAWGQILASEETGPMYQNLKTLYDEGIKISVATDAGNPGTLHGISIYDEMEAMQRAGIPPTDLIVMATKNGAIAMDRVDDIGTLEVGKAADLIILEKDPSEDITNFRTITHFMRGGILRSVKDKF